MCCCWPKKAKKPKKRAGHKNNSRIVEKVIDLPSEVSLHQKDQKGVPTSAGTNSTSSERKRRGRRSLEGKHRTGKKKEPSKHTEIMGELHKRMMNKQLASQEDLAKMLPDERKKRLSAAQKALGFTPNTAIMDRLVKRDKEKLEQTQPSTMSCISSSKMGDIVFGLPKSKKKLKTLDDDTQYPKFGKKPTVEAGADKNPDLYFQPPGPEQPAEDDEIHSEDEDVMPDETNWMYNPKEIQATQDIIRIADGGIGNFVDGDPASHSRQGIVFDPYAPTQDLENDEDKQQKVFGCIALRYGTFITTVQMAPTDKEKAEAAMKKPQAPVAAIINAGADVSQFLLDYPDDASALSDSDREILEPSVDEATSVKRPKGSPMAPQDRTSVKSSRRKRNGDKPRAGSKEKLIEEETQAAGSKEAVKKSKESRKGSREGKQQSREAKPLGKAKSKESKKGGSAESKKRSREEK